MIEKMLEKFEELRNVDICTGITCAECEKICGKGDCAKNYQFLTISKVKEIVQEAAKDGGREKINMEIKENTHIVIKREDAFKYLEETECQTLEELLCKIIRGRARDNKNPRNYYYIVNRDEPYAEIVKGVILGGEYAKSAPYQKGE